MTDISTWTVPAGAPPVRLDAFVRRTLPHLSAREAEKAIGEGAFRINGRRGRKGDRLAGGDTLTFQGGGHWLAPAPLPRPDLAVPVRYEDESILVLDKPAGMATHGFSGRETASLANFIAAARPELLSVGRSRWEPGLINRLDRGTSGLVLAAKDQAAFDDLRAQSITKKYWALVWGESGAEGTIDLPLVHDSGDRKKMTPAPTGKKRPPRSWSALTRFRRRGSAGGFSLLEVEIERGVTHQIRVHLQASGHPIAGDPLYGGGRADPFALGRQFLHACYLGFRHPKEGRDVVVESPLPEELEQVIEKIGLRI